MILTGKTEVIGEKPVRVTVSTTNPTLTDLRLKLGVRGDRPVTNCLRHDMARLMTQDGGRMYGFTHRPRDTSVNETSKLHNNNHICQKSVKHLIQQQQQANRHILVTQKWTNITKKKYL